MEIRFNPELDDLFGLTWDKQTIHPVDGFWKILSEENLDQIIKTENEWQKNERRKRGIPSEGIKSACDSDIANSISLKIPERSRDGVEKTFKETESDNSYNISFGKFGKNAPIYLANWIGENQLEIVINEDHSFYIVFYSSLIRYAESTRDGQIVLESVNLWLFTLGKSQLQADSAEIEALYRQHNAAFWSPFLAAALESLSQKLPPLEEPVYSSPLD